ncbi:putative Xaa-Pro aminopeptidase P [Spathaspora sp. JA1]|nr:putative Xaa-Pro aminopeptidase P [Spathaspora sp. JA1]
MPYISEKEPLLGHHRKIADENEISTHQLCPSFKSILTFPFQSCLPFSKPQEEHQQTPTTSTDVDDFYASDEPMIDLPYNLTISKSHLSTHEKLTELRKLMRKHHIGVYIIPSEDEHQSEYTGLADKRREFISEFTGSAGIAIITLTEAHTLTGTAALSTDGRYFIQAEKQLDLKYWKLLKQGMAGYASWPKYCIQQAIHNDFSNVISCDPRLISLTLGEYFNNAIKAYSNKFKFKPLGVNLVDQVWGEEKPSRSLSPVYYLPLKYTGEHTNDKLARIRQKMQEVRASHYLVTELDSIAWLFNLRADSDIPFNPVFFAYSIVTLNEVSLYVNKTKIDSGDQELHDYLTTIDNLTVKDYSNFYQDVSNLDTTTVILPEKSSTTYALFHTFPQRTHILHDSIIANFKIFKNKTESFNAKIAQYKDSLAFILFSSWLDHQLITKQAKISEYEAACKIYSIRTKLPNFKGLSYETISSTGANAAIIHYAPTKQENDIIDPEKIYLIDSGAQFLEGTTDITRSYKFGYAGLTKEYQKFYTLVLKGHLAVAMAKFPPHSKSTGTVLDAYSRQPLWNEGLDFNHGTGHGVGSFGNVHEGPLYISTTSGGPNTVDLYRPGAILTDEPGFYIEGKLGIRIESEIEVIECDETVGKTRNGDNFLGFDYLTKVPFCRKLIDADYLTTIELTWINEYHKSIRTEFAEKLLKMGYTRAYNWLIKETEPL